MAPPHNPGVDFVVKGVCRFELVISEVGVTASIHHNETFLPDLAVARRLDPHLLQRLAIALGRESVLRVANLQRMTQRPPVPGWFEYSVTLAGMATLWSARCLTSGSFRRDIVRMLRRC
jgi:hypothetical protein